MSLRHIAYALPALPGFAPPKTHAAWPVWRDSTTAKVKFSPLPKRQAVKFFHKARDFERQTRQPGKANGAIGRCGLLALHTLLFDIIDYASGKLTPSIETIACKACMSVSSAKRGLRNLKRCGVLNWIRRAGETRDEKGRFCLKQDTNAYGVLPPSQWLGFIDRPEAPPPHPSTWGATPPLPSVIAQAVAERQDGASFEAALQRMEDDPGDELAAVFASFGRLVIEREKANKTR